MISTGSCATVLAAVLSCLLINACAVERFDETDYAPRPPVWRIEKPDGAPLWLLATVHRLPAEQSPDRVRYQKWAGQGWMRFPRSIPLPWNRGVVKGALRRMETLVIERIAEPAEQVPTDRARQPFGGCTAPGSPWSTGSAPHRFPSDAAEATAFILQESGSGPADSHRRVGVEYWIGGFAERRKVPILALETIDDRMALASEALADLACEPTGDAATPLTAESRDEHAGGMAYRFWRDGDLERLDTIMSAFQDEFPALHSAILGHRNRSWTRRLEALLDRPGPVLVAIGMAHFAGPDNLVDLLAAEGVVARRIQ